MTQRLDIELERPLTEEERKKVQAFAASLVTSKSNRVVTQQPTHVEVEALLGMFAGMGGAKTDKELIREAWDEIAAKYD